MYEVESIFSEEEEEEQVFMLNVETQEENLDLYASIDTGATYSEKFPRYCQLKLKDSEKIVRVKPMVYTKQNIDEFQKQIKELLKKGLIEEIKSPHSSHVFLVMKHSELKREKARMTIKYKKRNKNLEFNGYFIPKKDVLVNQTRGVKVSTSYGYYQYTVLPFGICNTPQIF
ncbi:DNA-directed DNA polymerase [Handroanthus impetiginosus]|uniref:DNA-directed DNA polymerase n=1 Tax=Handroanthus impetiginosus TaxID=429701 RepID=A0A2G9HMH5_9LAMI|nr:DNA-directed DNA polymerase [Handroanthus impetiginosus]